MMPGGVSSPVRAIKPYPFYTAHAEGAHITTVDGATLVDCCMAYGPLLLGHAHPEIKKAIAAQLEKGWLYGTPTPFEPEFARLVTGDHPGMDMIRFVSSGSEATMAAIRLGPGIYRQIRYREDRRGVPRCPRRGARESRIRRDHDGSTDSPGVLRDLVAHTRQLPYNDPEALETLLAKNAGIAALIIEPVPGNIGPVIPKDGYLKDIREITRAHDVLLIFDEVITGYRLGIGGAQVKYGVRPDLTTLGKIIGGGLPIGAFCGRREIMEMVAPAGPVYQPVRSRETPSRLLPGSRPSAGCMTIRPCIRISRKKPGASKSRLPGAGIRADRLSGSGRCSSTFFRADAPQNCTEVKECDTAAFTRFWQKMLKQGIFLPPSQFETNFLSVAHTGKDLEAIRGGYAACR